MGNNNKAPIAPVQSNLLSISIYNLLKAQVSLFECIKTLTGHTNSVYSIIQLNNGMIASGSSDKTIRIWDPNQDYKCIKTLTGHTSYVISITQLNNGMIASGSGDKTIRIWTV